MNLFASVVLTSNTECAKQFSSLRNLKPIYTSPELTLSAQSTDEGWIVLCWYQPSSRMEALTYIQEHYEVLKIFHIDPAWAIDMLDVRNGDVMIPNTFLNESGDALFVETLVDKNYDLEKFGLILNGVCLSLDEGSEISKYYEERGEYIAEIADREGFEILSALKEKKWIKDSVMIRVVGEEEESIASALALLDVMI